VPSEVFYILLSEVLITAIVAAVLRERVTLEGVVMNGVVVTLFAATLIYDQKVIGFLVLVYAIFLIATGIKEYFVRKLGKPTFLGEIFDRFLMAVGHNYVVLALMLAVLVTTYLLGAGAGG